jgi:biotin carboxyl carrier protein
MTTFRISATLVAATVLTLGACGGSSESSSEPIASSPSEQSGAPSSPDTSVVSTDGQPMNELDGSPLESQDEIPAIIQNWGFEFADFNDATGMAGAMQIRGVVAPTFSGPNAAEDNDMYSRLIGPIGQIIKGMTEPQFTFVLPLGTPVISMVDGTVCDLPKLYSNDFSIRIAPAGVPCMPGGAVVLYEHEHVLNPSVEVGQEVKAGDQIAIVSDYSPSWSQLGFGILETGVFFSKADSNAPWHACLTKFLDPSKSEAMLSTLNSAFGAWESETGNATLYDEAAMQLPGCYTLDDMTDNNSSNTSNNG